MGVLGKELFQEESGLPSSGAGARGSQSGDLWQNLVSTEATSKDTVVSWPTLLGHTLLLARHQCQELASLPGCCQTAMLLGNPSYGANVTTI